AIKHRISPERYAARDWDATPEEAAEARHDLLRGWNKLHAWLTWLRRKEAGTLLRAEWENANSPVPFFWVVEYTKHGWPHLHVILLWRDLIDVHAIRQLWQKYGIGNIVSLNNKNRTKREPVGLATYL